MPDYQVQIDVKFLFFIDKARRRIKHFQYAAIDDATRVRALKVYRQHTQTNAMDFLDYVIDKFPYRINYVHNDNGHELQSKFH